MQEGTGNRLAIPLDEAAATARTGDVWLFRGPSVADRAIRLATNSPVNHVGMVIAIDDLPPLLWHAELGRSLPDVWTGEHQRGTQLHRLVDSVRVWSDKYGQQAWMRQIDIEVTTPAVGRTVTQCRARGHVGDSEIITVVGAVGRRREEERGVWDRP